MTKTTNYQLNQWAASDPIRRADFNADNAAIDAAIKAVEQNAANALAAYQSTTNASLSALSQTAYIKLLDVTTTTAALQVDLDVSGIDFTQYWKVELSLDCDLNDTLFLRTNNITEGYGCASTTFAFSSLSEYMMEILNLTTWTFTCKFFQPRRGGRVGIWINQIYLDKESGSSHNYHGISPVLWENLKTLNFYHTSKNIPAGTRFALYGLKK